MQATTVRGKSMIGCIIVSTSAEEFAPCSTRISGNRSSRVQPSGVSTV